MKVLNNKGFSLLELLVAIAVIAIGGIALFNGFVLSGRIHMNTTQLQMAEDVAQQVAEDFNSQYVDRLKKMYTTMAASNPTIVVTDSDPNGTLLTREVKFTNLPYIYSPRASAPSAEFKVDVTLKSIKTAGTSEVARDTTYKQNSTEAASFYQVNNTVGTNTFIVPEVNNIYDGESVVVSSEINMHDNVVVSDLYNAIEGKIAELNNLLEPNNQYNTDYISSSFNAIYVPYTNISNADQLIKSTDITIKAVNQTGGKIKYYYIVTCQYEFNFDFPVYTKGGIPVGMLSDIISDSDLAFVDSAAVSYKIEKNDSEYTVIYEKDLSEVSSDLSSIKGTFAGEIKSPDTTKFPTQEFDQVSTDASTPVPYIYFLYVPMDLYSDTSNGKCNDIVEFHYSGPVGNSCNIIRAFLVEQKVEHPLDPTVTSVLKNCKIDTMGYDEKVFKLYTNSTDIIDDSSNNIGTKYYLTNSYGKKVYNLYDMEIVVKDTAGNVVATYNTVKEE